MLFGKMIRKGIQMDADATEGATVGKDLMWPDGTVITEQEIRNPSGNGGTTTSPNTPTVTLWSLILNIPQKIKDIVALVAPGYLYHDGTNIVAHEWPLHDTRVESGETLTIPANKQYILWQEILAEGDIVIEAGGELVLLDEGLPKPTDPDFSYSGGDLSQIDYADGSQKTFTYDGGGNLTRVDFVQDGVTLRKDFYYAGGDLDYIDEFYV
jgi:hypothetical protein